MRAKGTDSAEDSDLAFHIFNDVVQLFPLHDLSLELRLEPLVLQVQIPYLTSQQLLPLAHHIFELAVLLRQSLELL